MEHPGLIRTNSHIVVVLAKFLFFHLNQSQQQIRRSPPRERTPGSFLWSARVNQWKCHCPFFLLASAAAQLDPSPHSSYGGGVCHSESWSLSLTYINPGSRTCVSVHAHMWPTGLQAVLCVLGFGVCNLLPVNVMLLYMLDSCSFSRTSCVEAAFSRCSSSMISGWLASLQPFCLSSATSLRIMSESIDGWMKS